ncbi:hypothetical protein [Acinetobacter puyangensis]|uniref:hypothetical protein n=1 Tax=Acinetobacter puyangensis TaxID=1096779 RepID=UPI003A4D3756
MKNIILAVVVGLGISNANAEIITNSKGDRVELKENGTWTLIPWSDEDFVNDGSKFTIQVPDGNKKNIDVEVSPDISLLDNGRRIKKKDFEFQVKMTSLSAQYKLKNPYSYVPKGVSVKQRGNNVSITIGSTGKNSYGADVPSYLTKEFYLEQNGRLKDTSMND